MILNSAPQAEAVMSNVGEIGEFRIRNSAKAFNILSSGLYANKIKAIVRELSCNAVDSHVAAGRGTTKQEIPFEVHLPVALEPHFSIRDFGTGLNHEQVTNIYTTYFESTKTNSNAFIGALGLGSKSPFSYTDNFTVTSIKDGRKGIYTAFINDSGVPSIALMMEEQTTEPAGVEVKFSVNDRMDFHKFAQEAAAVYTYFKLKPKVTGASNFQIPTLTYETQDIIPGVHSYDGNAYRKSRAIMGNIAYPIEVPNNALGDLKKLLDCGLELHFDIGELDFQASREGLSYIPQTIEAIRSKLEKVNDALADVLAKEADAIQNKWKRSIFLHKKRREALWSGAVEVYIARTKFDLIAKNPYESHHDFQVYTESLKDNYNLVLRKFTKHSHDKSCRVEEPRSSISYDRNNKAVYTHYWKIGVEDCVTFVKNDTKIGATERAKYHWRTAQSQKPRNTVFVMEPADRTKPMKFDEFFNDIQNPPEEQVVLASSLAEKPRRGGVGKNVSILRLEERERAGWQRTKYFAWGATQFGDLDPKQTYYYIPLKGYEMISTKNPNGTPHDILEHMHKTGISELNVQLYGVRKGDLEAIKLQKNWINIEDHLVNVLSNIPQRIIDGLSASLVSNQSFMAFAPKLVNKLDDKNNLKQLYLKYKDVKKVEVNRHAIDMLSRVYAKDSKFDPSVHLANVQKECDTIVTRYPLLGCLDTYRRDEYTQHLADYINMIDTVKGF